MRQKATLLISVIFILTISLLYAPQTAFAASHTITSGGSYDIAALYADGDIMTIDTTDEVTLTGSKNIQVVCNAGADLVLSSVTIDVSATSGACAILFTGTGNTLELVGASIVKSGSAEPGIKVEGSTALTISGSGSIDVTGGVNGAGIGGGENGAGGSITINDGTITATGGSSAAGIGGGHYGAGGTITIDGGEVTATGGNYGAGIGGGEDAAGGTITIDGGEVTAEGGIWGAGIGGGDTGDGGTITINGGEVTAKGVRYGAGIGGGQARGSGTITIADGIVTATGGMAGAGIGGGSYAGAPGGTIEIAGGTITAIGGDGDTHNDGGAGIGGGQSGAGGAINIDGGNIFAERGTGATHDIGAEPYFTGGTLTISGDAGVFLRNDASLVPTTTTHIYCLVKSVESGKLYEVTAPAGWTQGSAYLVKCTLSYDNNGATGSVADDDIYRNGTVTVKDKGNLTNGNATFVNWNTMANGAGTTYNPGDNVTLTSDMTLYAIWNHPATPAPTLKPTTKPKTTSKTITATPTPLATAAPTATLEQAVTPAPEPSEETKVVVPAKIISEDDGNVTIQINKNDLPEGTTAVSTPNGEVIAFGDEDTVQITVSREELGDDGVLELIVLNDENIALGAVDVQIAAQAAPVIDIPKAAPKPINIVLWIIGGIALVAVVLAAIYIIQARIRFG